MEWMLPPVTATLYSGQLLCFALEDIPHLRCGYLGGRLFLRRSGFPFRARRYSGRWFIPFFNLKPNFNHLSALLDFLKCKGKIGLIVDFLLRRQDHPPFKVGVGRILHLQPEYGSEIIDGNPALPEGFVLLEKLVHPNAILTPHSCHRAELVTGEAVSQGEQVRFHRRIEPDTDHPLLAHGAAHPVRQQQLSVRLRNAEYPAHQSLDDRHGVEVELVALKAHQLHEVCHLDFVLVKIIVFRLDLADHRQQEFLLTHGKSVSGFDQAVGLAHLVFPAVFLHRDFSLLF